MQSKAFVGGGSKEGGSNTAANAAYAGLAAAIAALAIVGGILLTKDKAAGNAVMHTCICCYSLHHVA